MGFKDITHVTRRSSLVARDVSGYSFLRGRVPAHLEAIFNPRQHYLDKECRGRVENAINKLDRRSESLFTWWQWVLQYGEVASSGVAFLLLVLQSSLGRKVASCSPCRQ
jgi:hypothetical protein